MDIKQQVYETIATLVPDKTIKISDNTALIGYDSLLDSMKFVELCLVLEELAADLGFKFDWTTDSAISKSRGIFSTAGTLANVFEAQYELQRS